MKHLKHIFQGMKETLLNAKLLSNLEPQGVEVHQYKSPVNFKNPASEYARKKENPVENDAEEKASNLEMENSPLKRDITAIRNF